MTLVVDTERRLVAIFAADVEGYSRLMGADEVGTLRDLTQRRAILDGLIAAYRGRIANTAGDSVLAEFASAVDAVRCAVEAQEALAEANARASSDRHINFRIGVHVGDVMVKGGDLFGDGVNIAARLQALAKAGCVCVSGVAHDQVRKILPFAFTDLGAQRVKNIEEPIRAFAVSATGGSAIGNYASTSVPLTIPDKPSIAVLPFQNMSGDPEQEYFADGMVEDIITALSRFKSLFVIARNSSFTYKGKAVDIKQVGHELGVRYVLEGSVRKAGGKVRITGQLVEAATGAQLWADRFDGTLDDIFELQDKVTSTVVASIAPRLEKAEIDRSERKPTELDAVDLYYRAIHAYRSVTRRGNEEALRLARQAIALDPGYSAAYGAALACYAQRREEGWTVSRWTAGGDEELAEGKQYALRAIEVGADDAFALSRAAIFFLIISKESEAAKAIGDQAIAVNPNLAEAWRIRGWINTFVGEHEPAIEQFQYAMRLNPLDPELYKVEAGLALANFLMRRFEIALSWVTKSIARQKNFTFALRLALVCYAMLERKADAHVMLTRLYDAGGPFTITQFREWTAIQRQEDIDLHLEAFRLAGVPE